MFNSKLDKNINQNARMVMDNVTAMPIWISEGTKTIRTIYNGVPDRA